MGQDRPKTTVATDIDIDGATFAALTKTVQDAADYLGAPLDEIVIDVSAYDDSASITVQWQRPMTDEEWGRQKMIEEAQEKRRRDIELAQLEALRKKYPEKFPPTFAEDLV